MSQAYTPGLQIKEHVVYRARRVLPIQGEVLVGVGDAVEAGTIVAKTDQPGEIYPINLANVLAVPPADVPKCMEKQLGDHVSNGDLLARSAGIFGLFKKSYFAKVDGTIESISDVTGQVIVRGHPIPVEVDAFVNGVVVEVVENEGVVVETTAAFLQGIFGIGGEARGPIQMAVSHFDDDFTPNLITPEHRGKVLIGGRRIHGETVAAAQQHGVAAIVSGGIDDQDLKAILGYDLGVAITGSEDLGITIIITEGFGEIAMAKQTFALFQSLQGKQASVNGATQIRAGVMRPEIVVPLEESFEHQETAQAVGGGDLEVGASVRLIRDPYFGRLGKVTSLPSEPQVLESGSKARVLEVACSNGETVTVPRANVEIIGE